MKRILSALSILVIGSATLWAQANTIGPDAPTTATQSPTASTKHLLKGTYVSAGIAGALGAGSFTNIDDASNVVCPGTSGNCLILADQVFQIGGTSSASRVAILLRVDGNLGDSPYNGDTLANRHFASLTSSHGITVPHGTHTVQTVVFTELAAQGGSYVFQYKVYKP